jgi:hypothetical protein
MLPLSSEMKLYYALHTYIHTRIRTDEPGYNDISLYVTSFIASDTLWYQLIPHC